MEVSGAEVSMPHGWISLEQVVQGSPQVAVHEAVHPVQLVRAVCHRGLQQLHVVHDDIQPQPTGQGLLPVEDEPWTTCFQEIQTCGIDTSVQLHLGQALRGAPSLLHLTVVEQVEVEKAKWSRAPSPPGARAPGWAR